MVELVLRVNSVTVLGKFLVFNLTVLNTCVKPVPAKESASYIIIGFKLTRFLVHLLQTQPRYALF